MTQEEKAIAYDEAIKRAKNAANNGYVSQNFVSDIFFPELKESDDEKIRKRLIYIIKASKAVCDEIGYNQETILDWLEKQKPIELDKDAEIRFKSILNLIDNGCPIKKSYIDFIKSVYAMLMKSQQQKKFSKKDWLEKQGEQKQDPCEHCKDKCLNCHNFPCIEKRAFEHGKSVFEISDENPIVQTTVVQSIKPKFKVGDWVVSPNGVYWHIDKISNSRYEVTSNTGESSNWNLDTNIYHKFTIQDAKDGDVLVNGSNIFIFHFINDTRLMGYCHVNTDDRRFYDDIGKNECFCLIDAVVYPATKEQREQLEKAMADAGYTFDFEKKELKKIEDEEHDGEEYDGEDYGIDSLWHAKNILENTLGKVDGYQTDDGILDHKCAISAVNKLYKQKPSAWSEKDTFKVQRICKYLVEAKKYYADIDLIRECIEWLKSLKDRIQPQNKWKPSEQEKAALRTAIHVMIEERSFPKLGTHLQNILNVFEGQSRKEWKPSDEQMKALNAINVTGGISYAGQGQELIDLYNDLKKLKG